jgi:hypothetical protein
LPFSIHHLDRVEYLTKDGIDRDRHCRGAKRYRLDGGYYRDQRQSQRRHRWLIEAAKSFQRLQDAGYSYQKITSRRKTALAAADADRQRPAVTTQPYLQDYLELLRSSGPAFRADG